ncbi:hypothetical protein [Mesorhizobium sp. CAU 1732]|uniref:hypothetical protein n=1 Tax=Mesorhizobium sp. CAU 1732 TaxID=3140358 RepID=UPI00326023B2
MTENDARNTIILTRLAAAVAASSRSIAEIEAACMLKRDRLRDFLSGRKRSIAFADAAAVSAELGVSLAYLAGSDEMRAAA